jgi:hypothetical protein
MTKTMKNIGSLAIGTVLLLLIPLALTIRDGAVEGVGWNWTPFDFVWAFTVIFGSGLAFLYVSQKNSTMQYRLATGLGLLTAFALIWVNAAVGIIGDENPANMLYGIVLLIGFFGGLLARFEAQKMSYVLFTAALAQFFVPVIGLMIWSPLQFSWAPGVAQVFVLNTFFAVAFAASGLLFLQATEKRA